MVCLNLAVGQTTIDVTDDSRNALETLPDTFIMTESSRSPGPARVMLAGCDPYTVTQRTHSLITVTLTVAN